LPGSVESDDLACRDCGAVCAPAARYCASCGQPRTRLLTCAQCGQELEAAARFCEGCGTATTRRETRPYTPLHLMKQVLRAQRAREGSLARVTIVFLDVVDSMALSERLGAELWHHVLDGWFEILTNAVHRFEGTINQYTGDGIMAIFGAPIAHENHALRACLTALEIVEQHAGYARQVRRMHGVDLAIRVGINSGRVVVGAIGDDLRMDYTAQGYVVGVAARLEALAAPGEILIADTTARQVEGFLDLVPRGEPELKGVSQPVQIFALQRSERVRTPLELSEARGFSPFVGRRSELAQICEGWTEIQGRRGRTIVVMGAAGVGKSRLVREFVATGACAEAALYEIQLPVHARTIPYFAVSHLLRRLLLRGEPEDATSHARIAAAAGEAGLTPAGVHLVHELLGLGPEGRGEHSEIRPERRESLLFDCVVHIIRDAAKRAPVGLVLDDAHWIDSESIRLLRSLILQLAQMRVLLLITTRPAQGQGWWSHGTTRVLELDVHPPDEAREHVGHLLGQDPSVAGLGEWICARTRGNAFFTEEIVRSLREQGILRGRDGALERVGDPELLEIPPDVEDVIAARVDGRSDASRRLLECVSSLGVCVTPELLSHVLGIDETTTRWCIAELLDAGLVYKAPVGGGAPGVTAHPLVQEVTYRRMLEEAKRDMHGRIVRAYVSLYPECLEKEPELLARHAEIGEQWRIAIHCLAKAGMKARRRAANRAAVEFFDRALEVYARAAERGPRGVTDEVARPTVVRIRLQLIQSSIALGERHRVETELSQLEDETLPVTLEERVALLTSHVYVSWSRGEYRRALEAAREALWVAEAVGSEPLRVATLFAAARVHFGQSSFESALELLAECSERLERAGLHEAHLGWPGYPLTMIPAFMAICHAERAEFDEANRLAQAALRRAERWSDRYGHLLLAVGMARVHALQGEWARVKRLLVGRTAITQTAESLNLHVLTGSELAGALFELGELPAARATLSRACAIAQQVLLPEHSAVRLQLTEAQGVLAEGDFAQAVPLARAVSERAARSHDAAASVAAQTLEGRALAAQGGSSAVRARQVLERALAEAKRSGLVARERILRELLQPAAG